MDGLYSLKTAVRLDVEVLVRHREGGVDAGLHEDDVAVDRSAHRILDPVEVGGPAGETINTPAQPGPTTSTTARHAATPILMEATSGGRGGHRTPPRPASRRSRACASPERASSCAAMRRGDYGYDAPYGLMIFASVALVNLIVATVSWLQGERRTAVTMTIYGLFFLGNALSFLYTTRRGKFAEWEQILDGLHLRGDERVLDMGCGRGAVLTAVARRLPSGRATGVDIWSWMDQSGNAREVTLRNASLEGVAERVTVETGDMRALPFPDGSFDLVVSSLAIHNIPSQADRRRAVAEGFRVLAPGSRIVIADLRSTRGYADELATLGAANVQRRRLGWRFWWGNPIVATRLVTAEKAQG